MSNRYRTMIVDDKSGKKSGYVICCNSALPAKQGAWQKKIPTSPHVPACIVFGSSDLYVLFGIHLNGWHHIRRYQNYKAKNCNRTQRNFEEI